MNLIRTTLRLILAAFLALPVQAQNADARPRARATFQATLEAFAKDHDLAKARAGFQRSAQEDPTYPQPRYNLALLAQSDFDWDAAIKLLEEVMAVAPASDLAAKAREQLTQLRAVREKWQTAEGRQQVQAEQALGRARVLLAAGKLAEAAAEADGAIAADPAPMDAYCVKANALAKLGNYQEATVAMKLALARAPAAKQPKVQQAIQELAASERFEIASAAGSQALEKGDYPVAAAAFSEAWRVKPAREDCGLRAAIGYTLGGRPDEAEGLLRRLTASRNLAVAREAAAQLVTVRAMREQTSLARDAAALGAVASSPGRENDEQLGFYWKGLPEPLVRQIREHLVAEEMIVAVTLVEGGGYVLVSTAGVESRGIPESLAVALRKVSEEKKFISRVVLAGKDQWLIQISGNDYVASSNFPPAIVRNYLDAQKNREPVTDVVFTAGGAWSIIRGDNGYETSGAPEGMMRALKKLRGSGAAITHEALAGGAWLLVFGESDWLAEGVPRELTSALNQLRTGGDATGCVALASDGGWLILQNRPHSR